MLLPQLQLKLRVRVAEERTELDGEGVAERLCDHTAMVMTCRDLAHDEVLQCIDARGERGDVAAASAEDAKRVLRMGEKRGGREANEAERAYGAESIEHRAEGIEHRAGETREPTARADW